MMAARGLAKLIEECCELGQIAAKKQAFPDTDEHPDGKGSMKARLEDEIGDVAAAMFFVTHEFGLDADRILQRSDEKLALFNKWHKED